MYFEKKKLYDLYHLSFKNPIAKYHDQVLKYINAMKKKFEVLNLVSLIKIQCARILDICNDSSKSSETIQ